MKKKTRVFNTSRPVSFVQFRHEGRMRLARANGAMSAVSVRLLTLDLA
jgi:hypothetical protein